MSTTPDAIDRYLNAVEYEWAICGFWGRYLGLDGPILQIPNAFTYRNALTRAAPILVPLLPIVRLAWIGIGLPILAIAFTLRWTLAGGWESRTRLPSTLYLHASNDRNLAFVPTEAGRPNTALVLPFRNAAMPGAWATRFVDLRKVSTRTNVVRAAVASVRAGWRLFAGPHADRVLFTYSAPHWFWVHQALENSAPASLWISNHVDRWAALATALPETRVTIVQHGDLAHLDARTSKRLLPVLPVPLPHVERVFVTDSGAVADFERAITGPGPLFERIALGLRTEAWSPVVVGTLRVLVVGHPAAHASIGRLIADVRARAGATVVVAYRPHPTERRPVSLPGVDSGWVRWLETSEVVPEVDIVVSYGSSVTKELIEATGATLVRWNPNDPVSVEATIDALAGRVRGSVPSKA